MQKAGTKLTVLAKLSYYMNTYQRRIILEKFIESQFGYCPLPWMFSSITLNEKINHLHERALRTVYRNYHCSYKDLLKMDQSFTVHQRNIQSLAI